jgi:hemerythrin superfamily protein
LRSLAEQTTEELGGPLSVLVRQKKDHVILDGLLERVTATSGEDQQEVLHRICRLVFSHAFAEEAVLWPALRRLTADGEQLTARVEAEHQAITQLVAKLEKARLDDPDRTELIDRTIQVLRQDVRDEEDQLLPRLQESVSITKLRRLGLAWEPVRRLAPTRAHPIVSRRPPGNVLAAVPLSVIDRSRDAIGLRDSWPSIGEVARAPGVSRRRASRPGSVRDRKTDSSSMSRREPTKRRGSVTRADTRPRLA